MPVYAAVFLIVTLSSIGLARPEWFRRRISDPARNIRRGQSPRRVAATGVILSAVYMLWMYQRVIWGEITNRKNETLPDLVAPRNDRC